jgi:hypothetical protein
MRAVTIGVNAAHGCHQAISCSEEMQCHRFGGLCAAALVASYVRGRQRPAHQPTAVSDNLRAVGERTDRSPGALGWPVSTVRCAFASYLGFCQTEIWLGLVLVKNSRFQLLHRSRKAIPARRAMRSSSDGHTFRNGAENVLVSPSTNQ